jgi:signal transduction histidine kinase
LFDRTTEKFIHYKNDPSDPSSLSDNSVRAILEDQEGNLWIGTWGGGLNKMDRELGEFTHYRVKDGLANDVIWGILEDNLPAEMGGPHLWIGTNQGLSRFDPKTETFRNYDLYDGLQDNSFYSAQAKTRDGILLFGGPKGFNMFNPRDIKDNPQIPPIVITDFQLDNRSVPIGEESVLKRSITESNELTLSWQDRVVSFEFAALSYTAPKKNRFRYMLDGFETQWNEIDSDRRFATYTNLEPGDYVFRVIGSNNDGVWNEEGVSLNITITPPWWGTTWFRGLMFLVLVGSVFGAYYWRVSSLQARSRELEVEVANKTRELQEEIAEREEAEQRLRRKRDELAILLDVSRDLISTLELNQLIDNFLGQIDQIVECDAVSIHILAGEVLELLTYQYNDEIGVSPPQILLYEKIPRFKEMLESQKGNVIADLQEEPALISAIIDNSEHEFNDIPPNVRSFMAAPMIIRNQGIGMLALSSAQPDAYDQDSLILIQTIANQVAVAIENAQLYKQAQTVAVAEERNRLARDLHDSTTQALYSALLFSETGKKLTEKGDLEGAAYYQSRVSAVVHEALKEMRLLVFEMRPLKVEEEGLVGALQMRLDAVESRSGIEARLYADKLPPLPTKTSENVYHIAQEALNNALKHALADTISVHLQIKDNSLVLEVVDNGLGFNLESVQEGGGMGLINMRERTEEMGGKFRIDSKPREGTRVQVSVPMEEGK